MITYEAVVPLSEVVPLRAVHGHYRSAFKRRCTGIRTCTQIVTFGDITCAPGIARYLQKDELEVSQGMSDADETIQTILFRIRLA